MLPSKLTGLRSETTSGHPSSWGMSPCIPPSLLNPLSPGNSIGLLNLYCAEGSYKPNSQIHTLFIPYVLTLFSWELEIRLQPSRQITDRPRQPRLTLEAL